MSLNKNQCPLCQENTGTCFFENKLVRIVWAEEPDYPAFARVILQRHASEMTDLNKDEQASIMQAVFAVESAFRAVLRPDKINLASLGNVVPHVHWHVIARFHDDRNFPNPIWSSPIRPASKPHFPENWQGKIAKQVALSLGN